MSLCFFPFCYSFRARHKLASSITQLCEQNRGKGYCVRVYVCTWFFFLFKSKFDKNVEQSCINELDRIRIRLFLCGVENTHVWPTHETGRIFVVTEVKRMANSCHLFICSAISIWNAFRFCVTYSMCNNIIISEQFTSISRKFNSLSAVRLIVFFLMCTFFSFSFFSNSFACSAKTVYK